MNNLIEQQASIEVMELWKFAATIAISCAISLGGQCLMSDDSYVTETQVKDIVNDKNAIIEIQLRYSQESMQDLKKVVENNNVVMQGVKEELVGMRKEIQHLTKNSNE